MRNQIILIFVVIFTLFGVMSADAQSKEFMTIYDYANSELVSKYRIKTSQIPGELIAQSVKKDADRILARKIDVIYQILVDGNSYYNGERCTFHTDIDNAIRGEWRLTEPHFSFKTVFEKQMDIKINDTTYVIFSKELGNDKREYVVYIHNTKRFDSNLTCIIGMLTLSDVTSMIIRE